MVHALHKVHTLVKPGGLLVDVHGRAERPWLEVRAAGTARRLGWLEDRTGFEDERLASQALDEAERRGWFEVEARRTFAFCAHATSYPELVEWLADSWETAYIPEETGRRIQDHVLAVGGAGTIVLGVPTRVTLLRSL